MVREFKVLEIYGSDKGCQIKLLSIPDDIGPIVLGDLNQLVLAFGESLQRFAIEVKKHNAKVLDK